MHSQAVWDHCGRGWLRRPAFVAERVRTFDRQLPYRWLPRAYSSRAGGGRNRLGRASAAVSPRARNRRVS